MHKALPSLNLNPCCSGVLVGLKAYSIKNNNWIQSCTTHIIVYKVGGNDEFTSIYIELNWGLRKKYQLWTLELMRGWRDFTFDLQALIQQQHLYQTHHQQGEFQLSPLTSYPSCWPLGGAIGPCPRIIPPPKAPSPLPWELWTLPAINAHRDVLFFVNIVCWLVWI